MAAIEERIQALQDCYNHYADLKQQYLDLAEDGFRWHPEMGLRWTKEDPDKGWRKVMSNGEVQIPW